MYKRILVPVDGSPTSTRGVREALQLAAGHGATLRFVHVVDVFVAAQTDVYAYGAGDMLDALEASGKRALHNAKTMAARHGVRCQTVLYRSPGRRIGDFIVREARKWRANVIVMGTHGRGGISRLVLGSDAEAVVRTSPVPVLLVRGAPARR